MLSVSLYAVGQNAYHAVFLGLPLGGSGEAFVDSLERRGYEIQNSSDVCTSLTGQFDGVGCIIEVHTTPKSHTVHQVSVSFVTRSTHLPAYWLLLYPSATIIIAS